MSHCLRGSACHDVSANGQVHIHTHTSGLLVCSGRCLLQAVRLARFLATEEGSAEILDGVAEAEPSGNVKLLGGDHAVCAWSLACSWLKRMWRANMETVATFARWELSFFGRMMLALATPSVTAMENNSFTASNGGVAAKRSSLLSILISFATRLER